MHLVKAYRAAWGSSRAKSASSVTYLKKNISDEKYLRWITAAASGYMRLKVFSVCELNTEEELVFNSIVEFNIDVYVPSFLSIYMQPSAVQGPKVVLKIRDFQRVVGKWHCLQKNAF